MIYKTFIVFRDTLTYKDKNGEFTFKEDCIYEHEVRECIVYRYYAHLNQVVQVVQYKRLDPVRICYNENVKLLKFYSSFPSKRLRVLKSV